MTNYLYSIRARHVADILNGRKTFELRKSAPKPPFVMWVYVTKAKERLIDVLKNGDKGWHGEILELDKPVFVKIEDSKTVIRDNKCRKLNGLVVAKCVVDSYKELYRAPECFYTKINGFEEEFDYKKACVTYREICSYFWNLKGKKGYALHLTQLEILDKPLQVSEFGLTRAPQSYQKVIPPEVRK